jgi:hypothetical protein
MALLLIRSAPQSDHALPMLTSLMEPPSTLSALLALVLAQLM